MSGKRAKALRRRVTGDPDMTGRTFAKRDNVTTWQNHPHSFRALFIRAGYNAKIPEYEIQGAAGHSDSSMTQRYDGARRGRAVATQVAAFRRSKVKL